MGILRDILTRYKNEDLNNVHTSCLFSLVFYTLIFSFSFILTVNILFPKPVVSTCAKISIELEEQTQIEPNVKAVILLHYPESQRLANQIKQTYWPEISEKGKRLRELLKVPTLQTPFSSREEKMHYFKKQEIISPELSEEQELEVSQLRSDIDQMIAEMHNAIAQATVENMGDRVSMVINQIELADGNIIESNTLSRIIIAEIPSSSLYKIVCISEIDTIDIYKEYKPQMNNSVPKVKPGSFWMNGYTGDQTDVDVLILDYPVDANHPALREHRYVSDYYPQQIVQGHGTMVAGFIASQDSTYKGVAYGLDYIINAKPLVNRVAQSLAWAFMEDPNSDVNDPAEAINYSWGEATQEDYSAIANLFDDYIERYNVLAAICVGNTYNWHVQPDPNHFQNRVMEPGHFYNGLCVGGINDMDDPTFTNQHIWYNSRRGPTMGGRKKPDLVAPANSDPDSNPQGHDPNENLISCNHLWETEDDWYAESGTSYATPHVAGGILLLVDAGILSHLAQKAILINSSVSFTDNGTPLDPNDDHYLTTVSHWDRSYGWGSLHLTLAYQDKDHCLFSDTNNDIRIYPKSAQGETHYQLFQSIISNWCKITLVWDIHNPDPNNPDPNNQCGLNNLDLDLWLEDDNARLEFSDSTIDNVEQVGPASLDPNLGYPNGIIKVYTPEENFDPNGVNYEEYALAIDNIWSQTFSRINGPDHQINLSYPSTVEARKDFTITATVKNIGDCKSHNNVVTLELPDGFEIDSNNPQEIGSMEADPNSSGVQVNWDVNATSELGDHNFSVTVDSNSYGETFSDSAGDTISVESPDLYIRSISAWDYYGAPYLRVGWPVRIKVRTKNQGNKEAGSSNTGLYINKSPSGTPFYSWNIGSLDPGETKNSYVNVIFYYSGWYYLYARADRLSQVWESNENNNTYGPYWIYIY